MKKLLDAISRLRLVVVGDLMLDHYVWGDAERISPEAPVPVVSVTRDSFTAGGAANVALNLAALGCRVELCGCLGTDADGARLEALLQQAGVGLGACLRNDTVPTVVKTRVVVRKQQLCRIDREAEPVRYVLGRQCMEQLLAPELEHADAVILSDYAKGVIDPELLRWLQPICDSRDLLLAVDPKPSRHLPFSGPGLMTPNRAEALRMAGIDIGSQEPFPAAAVCRSIWDQYRPRNLVVTLGAEGMLPCLEGEVQSVIPTRAREVFDVSGAGDTVIATLTAALAAGASLAQAAHLANAAAGVVVGKLGTATATPDEILAQ